MDSQLFRLVVSVFFAPILALIVGTVAGRLSLMVPVALVMLFLGIAVVISPGLGTFVRQTLRDIEDDIRLLFSKSKMDVRVERWKQHVKVYSALKAAGANQPPVSAREIDYLSADRLGILDRKFSTLLQVQSLLGIMVAMATSATLWEELRCAVATWWGHGLLFYIGSFLWATTIVGCLLAIGNPVWGDLWQNRAALDTEGPDNLVGAQQQYVDALVKLVIVRTAVLRTLTAIALANFWLTIFVIYCLLYSAAVKSKGQATVGAEPPTPPGIVAPHVPPPSRSLSEYSR